MTQPAGRMRHRDKTIADLDWMITRAKRPQRRSPLAVIPCELVLTINPGTNGRELIVRCRCMAGTVVQPARRYYSYDPLGVVQGLDAAKALYREHRASKGSQAA
jgi:hypothetical protein